MNRKRFDAIVEQLSQLPAKDEFILIVRDRETGRMSSAHSVAARETDEMMVKIAALIRHDDKHGADVSYP